MMDTTRLGPRLGPRPRPELGPRLCIDGRCDNGSYSAIVTEEIINQLVASQGETDSSNDWIEKGRTVLLTHPDQIFEGQWRRYNTKMPIGRTPLYWVWERNFVKEASLTIFHKFRQSDRLGLKLPCQTVTTVLSPGSIPRSLQFKSANQIFVVPSFKDRGLLTTESGVSPENILVVQPAIRRYCFFSQAPRLNADGKILIVGKNNRYQKKLTAILRDRFPTRTIEVLSTGSRKDFEPLQWLKIIEQTLFAVYLVDKPYDWATAALELFYWGIPVVFPDENGPLNELLPASPLRLSSFLVEQPELDTIRGFAQEAYDQLDDAGVFAPLAYARQFSAIYSNLQQQPS